MVGADQPWRQWRMVLERRISHPSDRWVTSVCVWCLIAVTPEDLRKIPEAYPKEVRRCDEPICRLLACWLLGRWRKLLWIDQVPDRTCTKGSSCSADVSRPGYWMPKVKAYALQIKIWAVKINTGFPWARKCPFCSCIRTNCNLFEQSFWMNSCFANFHPSRLINSSFNQHEAPSDRPTSVGNMCSLLTKADVIKP